MGIVANSIENVSPRTEVAENQLVLNYFTVATNNVWRLLEQQGIVETITPDLTVNINRTTNEVLTGMLADDDPDYEYLDITDADGVMLPSPFAPIPETTLELFSELHGRPNTHEMIVSSRRDKIGAVCDQITHSLFHTDFKTQIKEIEGEHIPVVTQADRQELRNIDEVDNHDRLFELFAHLRELPFDLINQKKVKLRFTLDIGGLLSFKDFDRFMWWNKLPVEESGDGSVRVMEGVRSEANAIGNFMMLLVKAGLKVMPEIIINVVDPNGPLSAIGRGLMTLTGSKLGQL